jgi:DNA-binding transcriptional ArsR family regulator
MPDTHGEPKRWHGVHKALADPLRIRIVEVLWETPRSAGELAEYLGLPADRLYYHLRQLEQAALIEVVEYRRLARGKVERIYAPADVEPPGDAADPDEMIAFLGSMLEATRADVTAAFRAKQDGRRREVDLHRGAVRLTEDGLRELRDRIAQLVSTFAPSAEPEAGAVWTRLLVTLVDLQDRPPTTDETESS